MIFILTTLDTYHKTLAYFFERKKGNNIFQPSESPDMKEEGDKEAK